MALMKKTKRQLAADNGLETEKTQAGWLKRILRENNVQIPAERLADFIGFLVSVTYQDVAGGIRLYAREGGIREEACLDLENHVYPFFVKSEESEEEYHTGFSRIARSEKTYELNISDLSFQCTCRRGSMGMYTKGGRIRLCKHLFAAMFHLAKTRGEKDPKKFGQLLHFLLYAVMWANPSEALLKKMRKARRNGYKEAWKDVLAHLSAQGTAVRGIKDMDVKKEVEKQAEEICKKVEPFSYAIRQQISAVTSVLQAILGGLEKDRLEAWAEGRSQEIAAAAGLKDSTLGRYEKAGEVRSRAAAMGSQLETMKGVAGEYEDMELGKLLGGALKLWQEGADIRKSMADSIEKKGLVPPKLSAEAREQIAKEIALMLELWGFYDSARRMLWEMAKEEKLHGLEEALKKMKK